MMKRFARKRRGGNDGRPTEIDAALWLSKIVEKGIVEAKTLEPWADSGVPGGIAAIGRGERSDGSAVLVAFSPTSAIEAMLGGLAAAQHAAETSAFKGELLIVAPQWPAGARRVLGLIGETVYSVEPVAAPALSEGRVIVEPEPAPRILAMSASQLASRMVSSESRSSFTRAAAALEGLAAKHGGCVRVGVDRIELVVLARRVAEIRADGENPVLEVQVAGRTTTPLSGADLAGALDGLEGQLRRRLNDRKVRDGEEGLRGRVIGQLAAGGELRSVHPWPQPGVDLADVDGVGVNATGDPVVVAIREEFDWRARASVLESLAPVGGLMPILFANTAPPLRLGLPRLLLAAERFVVGIERALSALTVAYELRVVSGTAGARVDLVSQSVGEGAESRAARKGCRRGGRGRSGGPTGPASESGSDDDLEEDTQGESDANSVEAAPGGVEGRQQPRGPSGPRSVEQEDGEGDSDDSGRLRGRRRRRSRRGGRGSEVDGENSPTAANKTSDAAGSDSADDSAGGGGSKRRRFEEVSLMDLDDGPSSDGDRKAPSGARDGGSSEGRGRSRRRGRRGGSDGSRTAAEEDDGKGQPPGAERAKDKDKDEDTFSDEDLVDADDLSEILARLSDDAPDFDAAERPELQYDDEEDLDEDGESSGGSRKRDSSRNARRGDDDGDDDGRSVPRRRSAILVHGDPDSLFAAVLLARDIRQIEGMWIYPQAELMTFFRSIATDLRDDTPIFLVGFTPSPVHDVIQASSLYKGRLTWFDRHVWPPEDLAAMRDSIGADAIVGGEGIDSVLPLVLETCSRRSRFSDKLVDLATGRFTQHDFERWGRLWRARASDISAKSGDIRADVAALLAGRPSDLAKEAALITIPKAPPEVAWVAERDFRLVHFGSHVMVVLDVDANRDIHLVSRIARERYGASLSLARTVGEEAFVFAGDETTGKRSLDYNAISEHLVEKLEWVEARPDADHVSRFHVRDLARHPERLEEVVAEIAMGRSLLER